MFGLFSKSIVDKNSIADFVKKLSAIGIVQFYEFANYKKTGKYCGVNTINYVFIPVNEQYAVPIWVIPLMFDENSESFRKCIKELHKRFVEYYIEYDKLPKPVNVRVIGGEDIKTLPIAVYTMNFLFPVTFDVNEFKSGKSTISPEYNDLLKYVMTAYKGLSKKRDKILTTIDYVGQLTLAYLSLATADRRTVGRDISPLANSVRKFFINNMKFPFYWRHVILSFKNIMSALSQSNNNEFFVVFETGKGIFATHFRVSMPANNGHNTPEKLWLLTRGGTTGNSPFGMFNFVPEVNGYKLQFFLLDKLHNVHVSLPLPFKIKEIDVNWGNINELLREPGLFGEVIVLGANEPYVLKRVDLSNINDADTLRSVVLSLLRDCIEVRVNGCKSVVIVPRFNNPARAKSTRFVAYELFGKEPYSYYAFDNVYYLALDYKVMLKFINHRFTRLTGVKVAILKKRYKFDSGFYNNVSVWFRFERDYERVERTGDPVMYSVLYLLDYKFNIHDFITTIWYNLSMIGDEKPGQLYTPIFSVSQSQPSLINQRAVVSLD